MKILLLSVLAALGTAGLLRADPVIQLDDLPGSGLTVPAGYHGLNWSGLYSLDAVHYVSNPSGYQAGVVSTNIVIYGGAGSTGVISAELFDLDSAYATAAWNDNLQFVAKGYIDGTQVYNQTNTLSATAPTLVHFNFYGVNKVEFTASGGTPHAGYSGAGAYFALDNVSVQIYAPFLPALITNGGFETGNFSSWQHFGNTNNTVVTTGASYVHSGTYGAQIGPVTTPGYLGQNVPTQIGELYSVSFSVENYGVGPNYFAASWGGAPAQMLVDLTNQPAFGWTNYHFNLLAERPNEYLEFQFRNDPAFFGFDDVSVTPLLLVSNGGFETDDFSGWTQSGNTSYTIISSFPTFSRAGSYGAEFGPQNTLGYISQTLPTTPGMAYQLSFWLDSPDGITPNEFLVQWNGNTLFDQVNLPATGWTNLQFVVTATGTNTLLKFGLRDDPSNLGLDEVSVTPVPLLQNGGFESGDFSGWTAGGNFGFCTVNTNYANAGFYGGQFGPVGSLGYLSQNVRTVPGQTYLIGFTLDNPMLMSSAEFSVAWNGMPLMDVTNLGLIGWLNFEFIVPASGTNSTLQFGFRDDPAYLGLDGVFVAPIPQPSFQSITKTGGLIHLTWGAVPDYLYQVQYSTDLTKTNWSVLFNSTFPATIPMTATDTNPPEPARFYRVLMSPPPLIF